MIVVNVELVSAIHESRSKRLATLTICNVGGTKTRGDYSVQAYGASMKPGKSGEVKNYPREAVAVLNLVRRAIEAAGYTK